MNYSNWMTIYLTQNDLEIAQKEAKLRSDVHQGHSTPRYFKDRTEEERIGILGEMAFSKLTGMERDSRIRRAGDDGIDFIHCKRGTIDVKTARKLPRWLLVKEKVKHADIFVLCWMMPGELEYRFLGWSTSAKMKLQPVKTHGYEILSHELPVQNLDPMNTLLNLLSP